MGNKCLVRNGKQMDGVHIIDKRKQFGCVMINQKSLFC